MKKKLTLISMIVFTMFLLSGCGKAAVNSELKFNTDGSGSRSVYATISKDDAARIEGGVEGLDKLLSEAAPEGVTIRRTDADNGDEIYQFTFFFDNIEQYNQKISQITGKDHKATWYTTNSVFSSNIEFTEDDCTTDLIQWAVDAIKQKIGGFAARNLNYEVKKNEVFYDNTLQYSGTDSPKFVINTAPKVSKASTYSTFSFDGTRSMKIEVQFEKGGLDRINPTDAQSVLSKYATKYSFDRANNIITYDLQNEEIDTFLSVADPSYKKLKFDIVKNPFQEKYEIYEAYTLKEFFSLFDMSTSPYIYDYVKLPAVMNGIEVSHTDSVGNVKVPEGYDIAGAYNYGENFTGAFSGDRKIDLKSISVHYQVASNLSVKRQIEATYLKNGCNISKEELEAYYKDYKDNVSLGDNGDTIKVTFISTVDVGKNAKDEVDKLSSFKKKRGLKYRYYEIKDDLEITRYLPNMEGYEWDREAITYDYTIEVEKDSSATQVKVGNLTLTGETELATAQNGTNYVLTGSLSADKRLTMEVACKKVYDLFYFYIIILLFLIVVGALVAVFLFMKKKNIIEKQDYDDLDKLEE